MGWKGWALGGPVGSFVENMITYDRNTAKAEEINVKALNRMGNAQREQLNKEEKAKTSLIKLANRKKGILMTSMKQFLELYERIITINFVEGDGIKELWLSNFTPAIIEEVKTMTSVAGNTLSTGQAIATMLVRGGISGVIAKESEIGINIAHMRNKQARVIESQAETMCVALDAMSQRSERLAEVLTRLNMLLLKSISNTSEIIEKNGKDRKRYSQDEKDCLQTCMNVASAVKKVLDTPLLDRDGEITVQSLEAIQIGEDYINRISNTTNI
ncbi:MAG: hypothetical protein AB7G87_13525 [Clostridia bacterium]